MIIRSEEDREILRECGRRLAMLLRETRERAAPGVTTNELDSYVRERIRALGDTPSFLGFGGTKHSPPFPGAFCMSVNDGLVHGIPNDYVLKEGDLLKIDGGIWHRGLCTDAAITIPIGDISREDEELVHGTKEALDDQIAVATAQHTLGDIGHAAEHIARRYNFGYPKELGGHGVGLEVHEPPFIRNYGRAGKGERLVADSVIALEPMFSRGAGKVHLGDDQWTYYLVDGSNGAHFEHSVIVGETEAEVLTVEHSS